LPENVNGFLAKVDSNLRSDTTKSLCDALDASGIEKHIRTHGTKGLSPNHLRFDFSHFAKVTDEELLEDFVNARIQEQLPLIERRVPFAQAVEEGAMAL
jgi:alanyl-tRNA synthetase